MISHLQLLDSTEIDERQQIIEEVIERQEFFQDVNNFRACVKRRTISTLSEAFKLMPKELREEISESVKKFGFRFPSDHEYALRELDFLLEFSRLTLLARSSPDFDDTL